LYIHSHTALFSLPSIPPELANPGPDNQAGLLRRGGPAGRGAPGAPAAAGRGARAGGGPGAPPVQEVEGEPLPARGGRGGAAAAGAGARGGGTTVQGLSIIKPPYDRITAYDMNTGNMLWQKTHSSTPDAIKNNPALKGLTLPRLGQPGRTFIGVLTTKTLVIAGEGGVHTNAAGQSVALLRAYDKATGEDINAEVNMPARQTGSPMTYMHNGKQYIVVAVTGTGANAGGELLAYALP